MKDSRNMSEYSPRLRAARRYAGLSQAALAEKVHKSVGTIKRYENDGGPAPGFNDREAIQRACGVTPGFIEAGESFTVLVEVDVLTFLGQQEPPALRDYFREGHGDHDDDADAGRAEALSELAERIGQIEETLSRLREDGAGQEGPGEILQRPLDDPPKTGRGSGGAKGRGKGARRGSAG